MALLLCITARPGRKFYPAIISSSQLRFRLHISATCSRAAIQWTPKLDSQIHELHSQGCTWKEIGASLNILPITCYRRYRSSIEPELSDFWTPERTSRLHELVLQPKSWSEIASDLNAGQNTQISAMACQEFWCETTQRAVNKDETRKTLTSIYFSKHEKDLLQQLLETRTLTDSIGSLDKTPSNIKEVVDWEKLAHDVFENQFTVEQLQIQYVILLRDSHRWTKKQDAILIDLVMKQENDNGLDEQVWLKASQSLKHHSPEDCKNRWMRLGRTLIKRNKVSKSGNIWSDEEIRAYWSAWQWFGNDWKQVSDAVRSIDQDEQGATTSVKTAKDCKDDFKFLIAISSKMGARLGKEFTDLARNFSSQPRIRARWTEEQLGRLEDAIKTEIERTSEGNENFTPSTMIKTDIDWKSVAHRVGGGVTGSQCWYRWLAHQKAETNVDNIRTGRWHQSDILKLNSALADLKLFGLADRLPKRFSRYIQREYCLNRTTVSIRDKAKEILEASLSIKAAEASPLHTKSLQSLRELSQTGQKDAPVITSPTSKAPLDQTLTISESQHNIENEEFTELSPPDETYDLDDDGSMDDMDDMEERHLHPQMFIAPGILKMETTKRQLKPGSKGKHSFIWQPEDEDKLEELVNKYGQSTLAWKLIANEMSIPVRKCRDKWHRSFNNKVV
ncbi:hypothetical protein BGX27_005462 [Mortierella sp. AM989]|nr:hypothetical protein BGX27_005462 [Mortierella sp. AM989]